MSQTVQRLLAQAQIWNGSAWVSAPGDATNGLDVDVTRSVLPTGAAQEHATAASPHSARLTDGATYIGSTAQRLHVDDGGSSLTVDGPVTDAQLRASAVPVSGTVTASGPLTDTQLRAAVVPTQDSRLPAALDADGGLKVHQQSVVPVSDNAGSLTVDAPVGTPAFVRLSDGAAAVAPLTDTQLRASAVPVSISSAPTVSTDNIETLADNGAYVDGTSHVFPVGYIFDEVAGTALTENDVAAARINANRANVTVIEDGVTRGRYGTVKAASTAAVAADPAQVVSLSPNSPISAPTLTKGTQGATGVSTQQLHDAGRNTTNYFHAAPIITTTAEVMQTLTGYKSGAAVGATATPAVVTAGKTYRVERITVTYVAATVIGGALVRLRANLSGVGVVTSPLVAAWYVGMAAAFVAGEAITYVFEYPEGLEFAAGTGIALGVLGGGAVPTTGTIAGYVMASIEGYEY